MSHTAAIQEAITAYRLHKSRSKEQNVHAAIELAEWGLYSNRQIAALTGLRPAEVGEYTGKKDNTGGRMDPAALPLVLELVQMHNRGEVDYAAVKRTLDAGISSTMLARLTGRSQVTLSRHARLAAAA